ncbi:MAG: hypothetical protein INR73_21270 [Williamsia sp.]|nr:hypothetical protein [Williamsia sp.]
MRQLLLIVWLVWSSSQLSAQELFVFTEPASLMPANSLTAKLGARFPDSKYLRNYRQRYTPELMVGISKKVMVHASTSLSNYYSSSIRFESAKLYGQWRFFTNDGIHNHFRMAAFGEAAYTRNPFIYEELSLDGDHSGFQGGLIATQLINKLALSATASAIKVVSKNGTHAGHDPHATGAFNYTVSAGYLLFPRNYTSYNQPNLNIYVELLGMQALEQRHGMLDLAPALQLILNSRYKINAGYRFQLAGDMLRAGERTLTLGIETTFLGALQKTKKQPVNE